jgi:hypothetical protein
LPAARLRGHSCASATADETVPQCIRSLRLRHRSYHGDDWLALGRRFFETLRLLGEEGTNLVVEHYAALAAEVVSRNPDVIVTNQATSLVIRTFV